MTEKSREKELRKEIEELKRQIDELRRQIENDYYAHRAGYPGYD